MQRDLYWRYWPAFEIDGALGGIYDHWSKYLAWAIFMESMEVPNARS